MARFRFGAHIGSGGFGDVDEATMITDDGAEMQSGLARKKLLPAFANDADALGRFRREVRMLAEMDHEHILPIVGRNLSADPPWFIMPRAESSLADELTAGPKERDWVVKAFSAVLSGMSYAHGRKCIHRDLKPANILLVGGVPKVSDFGLGKRMDTNTADLTKTAMMMGTVAYMAPEQFTDAARVGPSADVYALGKILFEMLTGAVPLVGRPRADAVPEEFRSFIEKCTADDPGDRYASASDADAAFRLLVSSTADGTTEGDLESLLKTWESTPLGDDDEVVHNIAALLTANREQEEMLWNVLPRLPTPLVEQIIDKFPQEFDLILRAYNGHIQGGLPFDYCDVVANFYRQVYRLSADVALKQLVLERLINLGPSHNRWHVGDVVAVLLESIGDKREADMAADVIRGDPMDAVWFERYILNRNLPSAVTKAFDSLKQTSDDFPF